MDSLDSLQIALHQQDLFWINICLAFLMYGVALDISMSDFTVLFKQPKPVVVGLLAQLLGLPALTLGLIYLLKPDPGIALGMLLVASCPGGNVSNFLVHLANGNRALSVSLTSVSTLISFAYTPASLWFWGSLYPPTESLLRQFHISISELLLILTQLILIPLALGIATNRIFKGKMGAVRKWIRNLSVILFLGLVAGALVANANHLVEYVRQVFLLVFLHNALAIISGLGLSRLAGLGIRDQRTIAIETGIQNSGLGLIIILNFYDGMGSMLLVAAWWAVWHLISGSALVAWWSYRRVD
jgi:bile acid:Na+ symporter, BASS family